jgi:hypothetical protein
MWRPDTENENVRRNRRFSVYNRHALVWIDPIIRNMVARTATARPGGECKINGMGGSGNGFGEGNVKSLIDELEGGMDYHFG